MKGYKLTVAQKNQLIGKQWQPDCTFNPIEDKDGFFFIFDGESEPAKQILGVSELPFTEYVPKQVTFKLK